MTLKFKDRIHNQHLYIGNEKKGSYFEGWYFKHTDKSLKYSISFIVGISKADDGHSFIQVIDSIKNKSSYIRFALEDFEYSNNPFYIKIKDNMFSLEKIIVNLEEPININVDISYNDLTPIKKSIYAPNIMGPFAYLTFMECNHAVISLKHRLKGYVKIYDQEFKFDEGLGYIEKDYGVSFPQKYIWIESNSSPKGSIFFSVAKIPFFKMKFQGFICILEINNKQYRFATYYLGRIKVSRANDDNYLISIKQGKKLLEIKLKPSNTTKLISPQNGKMKNSVKESLSSICYIKLIEKGELIFAEKFVCSGSEIENY